MIRLASTKHNSGPSSLSGSSISSRKSSTSEDDSEPATTTPLAIATDAPRPATAEPTIDNSLPIWEDYMPEVERLEELTRALGKYLEKKKTRTDRSPSSSSSESSDKENKAPVAAVVPIKKKPGIKVSQEAPATPTKVAKADAVTPKTPRKKKRPTPPAVQPKKKKKESLPKNKRQLLQLAQKFSQAIEKNF